MGFFGSGVNAARTLQAFDRSLAIINFDATGKILSANKIFCDAMGYTEEEIRGRQHSIFVDPAYAQSPAYTAFWNRLRSGEFFVEEFQRFGKGGREVWIQGSYNPVRDGRGRVCGVTKIASVVTETKLRNAEYEAKVTAISRAQAIIEFDPSGTVLTANDNFLNAFGYRLDEVVGRHHRIFVEPDFVASADYQAFWERLNRGEFVAAEFKRLAKSGTPVWIEASYNPIFDLNGRVYKIVKFATVTTSRVVSVNAVAEGLAKLADKKLTHRITQSFAPAFETLKVNFNTSMNQVEAAMLQLSDATTTIHEGVSEIAKASGDLSRRTEQQAASLEQTAAALHEISSAVQRGARNTKEASGRANGAKADAGNSGTVMAQATSAMADIENSSAQINQIISEMAASTQEQSTAIAEVTTAVNEMDGVTQRNAAMVEETSAAAMSLGEQAAALAELVASFELSNHHARPASRQNQPAKILPLYGNGRMAHGVAAHG